MRLDAALAQLGWEEHAEVFRRGWKESAAAEPDGELPFLQPEYVRRSCRLNVVGDDLVPALEKAAVLIQDNPGLRAVAWYCHHRLFVVNDRRTNVRGWPVPLGVMGDSGGLFYALIALSGTEHRERIHAQLGVPAAIVRDSVRDLDVCIRAERPDAVGARLGFTANLLYWILLVWRGQLYRLGRLEYIPGSFRGKLRAFRNRCTGAVLALAEEGCRFRADGHFDGAGGVTAEDGVWETWLRETDREVHGFPIVPEGHAVQREVRLSKNEWHCVLAPGDPVLQMHIPGGEPMTFERCGESLRQALDFFQNYFPATPFVGMACGSWILDAQFQQLLPPTSNLARFEREVYLYPVPGGTGEIPWQVRVREDAGPPKPPPMTTMQKAFYGHIERGGHFRNGGCFLLAEDFAWGGEVYHRQRIPELDSGQ